MNRCLHITIQENAGALPPRATAQLPGRAGTDPRDDNVMPRLENPRDDNVMPRLENPRDDNVMPRLENPDGISYPSGAGGDYGAALATACSCCCVPACQDTAAQGKATPHPFFGPRDYSGFVIVRMAEGIENDTARSLWQLAKLHEPKLDGLEAALEIPREAETAGRRRRRGEIPRHFVSRPLIELPGLAARADELYQIRLLEQTAATSPFPPLHSLTAYWRLDLRKHPRLVEEVVARLNLLAEVDLAYRELAAGDPKAPAMDGSDFAEDQGYLADAPVGIGAAWARHSLLAPSTSNVSLCDLEQGWNLGHEDLKDSLKNPLVAAPLFGDNRAADEPGSGNHGTAVLGILVATGSSSLGVKGAAAGLGSLKVASHYKAKTGGTQFAGTNSNVAEAIAGALAGSASLMAGDVLLLEVQRGRLPTEVDEADCDAIRLASGLGVIVIEAAGNGDFDLDTYSVPSTGRSLHRSDPRFRDSGAILVGAARAGLPHDRAPFSNYGSRLDCFGWGEAVTTCGYGDLAGTGDTSYTNSFSGTSSASAIVAGATVLLQSLHETHTGMRLEPQAMREILADLTTGTHQGPNVPGNIGVMPDLKAIVRDRLLLVPDVYLRRSIGDDGAPPALGDEISSSPDILVSSQKAKIVSLFGAGSPEENLPAPGEPVVPGAGDIYLRLRNRGLGEGKVHVQLFASPAATLITPERWLPVGRLEANKVRPIPQGDTVLVAGPVPLKLPGSGAIIPPPQAWSLLAILSEPEETPSQPYFDGTGGMPPGPPYFDWAEYRAFLRGPSVAWRNTHRVTDASPISFFIAGTPDRAHLFDFEVIQHLPAGATVTLQVPPALAAKLHQRQPWLDDGTGLLPKRPRIAIRGVELAAGTYAKAEFTVRGPALTAGHSLAIRQLWRGEEVGRITWFFGPAT